MSVWINGYVVDARGVLGDLSGWELPRDLTEDEATQINDAIADWEDEDPDGYDEAAADRLDRRVEEILSVRRRLRELAHDT